MRHFFDDDYYEFMDLLYDEEIPDIEEDEEDEEGFDLPIELQLRLRRKENGENHTA